MKKIVLFFICPILLAGCNSGSIFKSYENISDNKWARDKIVTFDVSIEDTSTPYDIELAIRHSSYYVWANIKINITIVFPSGEERIKDFDLMLRNKDGSFKAEGAGDLWDINFPVFSEIKLSEKGIYHFKIQNIMPQLVTEDIMQVGLIVKKAKK